MEARHTAELTSAPKSIEEVDAWMANYLSVIDAVRAEALRVERLRDAAPDLVRALQAIRPYLKAGEAIIADAALAKAGASYGLLSDEEKSMIASACNAHDVNMTTLERIAYDSTLTALDMAAMARAAIQGAAK